MSIIISPNLPANVVEIGNEITAAKLTEINSGTLALQSWVTTGFAPKASPTFTGTVTIPAGANITGYLTTSSASSTYQPIGSYALLSGTSAFQVLSNTIRSVNSSDNFVQFNGNALEFGTLGSPIGMTINNSGITFSDASSQTTAGIPDAPSDGETYARSNGAWVIIS